MRLKQLTRMLLAFSLLSTLAAGPAFAEEQAEPRAVETASEDDAKLLARAQAYWEARVGRSAEVMNFYAPAEKLPEGVSGVHAEGGAVSWTDFEIEAVQADGDDGLVQVIARMHLGSDYESRIPPSMRHMLRPTMMERWIRVEGEWYKRPIEPGLSRMMRSQRQRQEAARTEAEAKAAADAKAPATTATTQVSEGSD